MTKNDIWAGADSAQAERNISLFRQLAAAESRRARAVAYRAALAIIG